MSSTDATQRAKDWLFPAIAFQLCVVMLLGGTARPLNVLLCFIAALPVLYCILARARAAPLGWVTRIALGLFGLAWLQLIPLPEAIWTSLPGRSLAAEVLRVTGLPLGWRPLALDPGAALVGLLSLMSPLVLLFAFARLSADEQRTLLRAIVILAALTAIFGIVQRVSGSLTLYDRDHAGFATGLFANRNHHAVFLACALVMVPALQLFGADKRSRWIESALVVALFMGILATTSRAGIALGGLAVLASLALIWRPSVRLMLIGSGGLALVAIATLQVPALAPIFDRFGTLGEDQRLIMAEGSWAATRAFFPWGSGWGSFVPVYMAFEDLDTMTGRFVVAAHNDYLQLALEGGLLGVLVALAGPLVVAILGFSHWKNGASAWQWGLWWVAALLLMHSAVDFPLRTDALAALFALALAAQEKPRIPLPAASPAD